MSSYAVTDDGTLIVSWWSGEGHIARLLARSPASRPELLGQLAGELTRLAEECWQVYVEPVTSDIIAGDVDGRQDLDTLAAIIRHPELPTAGGYLTRSYIPVVELTSRAARTCHAIGDPELTAAVAGDVQAETAAVLSADLGDLTGRGQQAALLSRTGASPAQVEAAWQTLAVDPLDGTRLLTDFDPAAAAVAALAWLRAAAGLAGEAAGLPDAVAVIMFADDIEAMPVPTLTVVLDAFSGDDPYQVVAFLVDEAKTVAAGRAPDVYRLDQAIQDARALAGRYARVERDVDALLGEVRLCVLDPLRPAPDLLEDLVTGIYACWLVWEEAADRDDAANVDDPDDDEVENPAQRAARRRQFCDELRAGMSESDD